MSENMDMVLSRGEHDGSVSQAEWDLVLRCAELGARTTGYLPDVIDAMESIKQALDYMELRNGPDS